MAARCIKKLGFELGPYKERGVIPAKSFSSLVDLLLSEDAGKQAETNPDT